jgi:hypothetical protein
MPAGRAARPSCRRSTRSVWHLGQTGCVPPGQRLSGPVSGRGDLIARLAAALVIDEGRRSGDPETRVGLDHRLPDPGRDDPSPRARWRLATSSARLYPPPVARKPLSVWHSADGAKGRRLVAGDLANDNRVAAVLASTSPRSSSSASGAATRPTGTTATTTSSRPELPRSARARCARLQRPSASAARHAAQRRTHRPRVALAPAVRRRTRRFRP